jgi:hypothetical protein
VTLKTRREIQRAHDILKAIVLGEVPIDEESDSLRVNGESLRMMLIQASLDTLCWVLEHKHNTAFAENLVRIESALERIGFVLKEVQ